MNILHLTRRFFPCLGGVETYIWEISTKLKQKGVNSRVITLCYDILNRKQRFSLYEQVAGVEIFRIPGFGYYKKPIPLRLSLSHFKWADIVYIHDVRFLFETAVFLKKIYKYALLLSTHGFILHTKDWYVLKKKILSFYFRPLIEQNVDALICDSKQDFEYSKSWNCKNHYLIENGIDYEKFGSIVRQVKRGKFLYFGKIDKNKGIDLLFKTLGNLKNCVWDLDIIGSGFNSYENYLKTIAVKYGISNRILWKGFVSEKELFESLSEAQICFLPSTYEGFGFTLIEAMSAGCICVANTIKPYQDAVQDGKNGFLIDFSKSERAAEKIRSLLNYSREEVSLISSNSRRKAEEYGWDKKINKMFEIFENITKK